jgi:hypothetical protein
MIEHFLGRGVWMKNSDMIVPSGEADFYKEQFFRVIRRRLQILDNDSYLKATRSSSSLSNFRAYASAIPGGTVIEDVGFYLNKDAFRVKSEDFGDVIPVVVHHRIFQFWQKINNAGGDVAAKEALVEKYKFAIETGSSDRYLKFIWRLTRRGHFDFPVNVFEDNLKAYQEARKKQT